MIRPHFLLLSLLVLAFGLRIGAIDASFYHPDEKVNVLDLALRMLAERTLEPGKMSYGSLALYVQAAVLWVASSLRALVGITQPLSRYESLVVARVLSVLASVGTVALTALLARAIMRGQAASGNGERIAGWLAPLFLAVAFLAVQCGHYNTVDNLTTLLTTASVVVAFRAYETGHARFFAAAGLLAGLGAAAKYTGALCVLPLAVLPLVSPERPRPLKKTALGLLCCAAGFVLGMPYAVIRFDRFFKALLYESNHYLTGGNTRFAVGSDTFQWNLEFLYYSAVGPGIAIMALLGLVWLVARWRPEIASAETEATSLTATASSPAATATLPEGMATAPGETASSPAATATLPEGMATAPGETASSPAGTVASPEGMATAPGETASSPAATVASPRTEAASPGAPGTFPLPDLRRTILFLLYPVVAFLFLSCFKVRFDRNLLPILPFLVVLAALYAELAWHTLRHRWRRSSRALLGVAIALSVAHPLMRDIVFDQQLLQPHTKRQLKWWKRALPPGTLVKDHGFAQNRSLRWLQEHDFDYVVMSSHSWEPVAANPDRFPRLASNYVELFRECEVVATFRNPWFDSDFFAPHHLHNSATVNVYHGPTLKVLKIPKGDDKDPNSTPHPSGGGGE